MYVCVCGSSEQMSTNSGRGAQKAHRAVPNEALDGVLRISRLITWTYLHSFCTNFNVKSFFRERQLAKPRTGQMTSLRGLHVCRNLIFVKFFGLFIIYIYIIYSSLKWKLFEHVPGRGLDFSELHPTGYLLPPGDLPYFSNLV